MLALLQQMIGLYQREGVAVLLALPRAYSFFILAPLLNPAAVPRGIRGAIILVLLIPVFPGVAASAGRLSLDAQTLALIFAKESIIGFLLGYLVGWIFWAVQSAGDLADNQRGAAIASSIDPLLGLEASPIGMLFAQAFYVYVYASGAALAVLGVYYGSYKIWPVLGLLPTLAAVPDAFPAMLLHLFDRAMRYAVLMAAPLVIVMFLAEFALALVSRFTPQLQVFVVAMPVKSGIAMFMLIFYFSILMPYASDRFLEAFGAIDQIELFVTPDAGARR